AAQRRTGVGRRGVADAARRRAGLQRAAGADARVRLNPCLHRVVVHSPLSMLLLEAAMTSEPVLQPMPRDKADLMARIPPARAALEEIIRPLSETQLSQPGPDGGWAVKDHLAHVATWEQMLCAHLRDSSDHAVVGLEPEQYATMSLDELNAHIDRL